MLFQFSKKKLNNNINLYFTQSGKLYVSGPLGVISSKLFFSFDLNYMDKNRVLTSSSFKHLFSGLNFLMNSVSLGYYIFVDMVGLGYKLKKVTNIIYRFYLGQSHFIYIYVPKDVLLWAFQNKITLFSIYADKLFSISSNIMLLRKLNSYKLRGLIRPGQIIILKEGKQR